jgi:tRNA pseudouridine38-40 synthase
VTTRNIRLLLAFDGTAYSGWQRQKDAPTIQGEIERCLQRMSGVAVTLHGAGRTDAGVHALGMVANFRTQARIPCPGFLQGLNSMLPPDIRILDASEAPDQFHSRYSATGKTYRYAICTAPVQLPTQRLYAAHVSRPPDAALIRTALARVIGCHDFSSFEGTGSRDREAAGFAGRGAVRTLYLAEFTARALQPDTCFFRFTGDGFLRHMVRNLVGTLLLVGNGRLTPEEFAAILRSKDRTRAGATAPAHGLLLERVHYEPVDSEIAPPC